MSYNASALAPNITQAVRELRGEFPNAPLYVAGHSMGAAMAHICALDMKFTLGFETINVYTFGSPRVGNDKFKLYYNKIVNVSHPCTAQLLNGFLAILAFNSMYARFARAHHKVQNCLCINSSS